MNPLKTKSAVAGIAVVFATCITYLTAWSPPDPENNGENVNITNGGVNATGPIQTKSLNPSGTADNIIAPDAAAFVAGSGNDLVRTGSATDKGSGLVLGAGNSLSSLGGSSAVIGSSNNVWAPSSLVVGFSNNVTSDAVAVPAAARYTAVFGLYNTVKKNSHTSIISGAYNTVSARYALVTGNANTVEGSTIGSVTNVSAAIGSMNHIMSNNSWTMGSSNEVSSDLSTALGIGLVADSMGGTFVGKWSAPTLGSLTTDNPQNPVFVIGNGADSTNRSNALVVKQNGDIIITKPQGDISMGDYQ